MTSCNSPLGVALTYFYNLLHTTYTNVNTIIIVLFQSEWRPALLLQLLQYTQ